jgi:hypothetical protein
MGRGLVHLGYMQTRNRASLEGVRQIVAGLAVSVWAVVGAGCGRHDGPTGGDATEAKQAELKAQQIALARQSNQLPSLTTPYATFELFDDPVEVSSSAAPCVTGGDINNTGTVVGWDCRTSPQWWGGTGVLPGAIGAPAAPGLSNAAVNHAVTHQLQVVSGSPGVQPSAINQNGDIAANVYMTATAKWAGVLYRGSNQALKTLTGMPSQFQILAMTDDTDPLLVGGLVPTGSSLWGWFKYQTTANQMGETLTTLSRPAGNYTNGYAYSINSHHGGLHDIVGSFTKSDGTSTAMWYDESNPSSPWLDLTSTLPAGGPFLRLEQARDVNNSRWVVGIGMTSNSTPSTWYRHPFLMDLSTRTTTDLGTIPGMSYPSQDYMAMAINVNGHVVGTRQRRDEVGHGRPSLVSVHAQAAHEHAPQRDGHGALGAQRLHLARQHGPHEGVEGRVPEGCFPVQRLIQRYAEAELVRARVRGLAAKLFGRHVQRRAQQLARAREVQVGEVVRARGFDRDQLGFDRAAQRRHETEVHDARRAVRRDHDVLGLEVAVHQAGGVRGCEPARGHRERAHDLGGRALGGGEPVLQRLPVDELHDDEDVAVVDACLVYGHDVRMREARHRTRLAE